MPITEDIMNHKIIGPKIREGIAIGMKQGLERGLEKGVLDGERRVVLRMIEKRFGKIPEWAKKRIKGMGAKQLEVIALRLFDAAALEQIFD